MDEKVIELIGIGAAYAGDCEPCLAYHIKRASELGLTAEEIRQAIHVAHTVKNVRTERVRRLAGRLLGAERAAAA